MFPAPLWHSVLLYLSPALHPPLPLCPVALLCSLNRNDSLYLWINKDSIHTPWPLDAIPRSHIPYFLIFCSFSVITFSLTLLPSFSSSQSARFFSHPVCYLHLAVADSQCTFIALSFAKSASSIQVLSAWVLYFCAQELAFFFFACMCAILWTHIHQGNKHCCLCQNHMSNVYYSRKHKAITLSDETGSQTGRGKKGRARFIQPCSYVYMKDFCLL